MERSSEFSSWEKALRASLKATASFQTAPITVPYAYHDRPVGLPAATSFGIIIL
jgi:hypothetical protein